MIKNYLNQNIVNGEKTNMNISTHIIEINKINGNIYRSDSHTSNVLRPSPAYFGDYESATKYLSDGSYMKSYITKGPINLLSLNNNTENIERIHKFFKEYLFNQDKHKDDIKPTLILLQILYGLVVGSFKNLDLCDLTIDNLADYFVKYKPSDPRNIIIPKDINMLSIIINDFTRDDVIPSRCSLRKFDGILMDSLYKILDQYGIKGIWYDPPKLTTDEMEKRLCIKVNKDYYKKDTNALTCVPSEMCIFNPNNSLKIIKMQQRIGKQLIDKQYKGNFYANKYKKYKNEYLAFKNKS